MKMTNKFNRHAGTQSTYDMYKNKLKQEIDFIKKILFHNGYPEDIVLKLIFKKNAQFSTANSYGPDKYPLSSVP